MSLTASDLVAAARQRILEVTPRQVHDDPGNAVVIDVREPAEFESGHLPGAVNIPRGVLEFKLSNDPALCARELNIVLYCKTSGRAALAACSLQAMGYRHVQSLAGGFDAWSAAGKAQVAANLPNFE